MNKLKNMNINIGLNMQDYYDDLVLLRNFLDEQIEVLGNSLSIYTHTEMFEEIDGINICAHCGKIMDSGKYDYCYCKK